MNITDVVNDIKLSQGLNNIALPYKSPVENVIQEILKITVREFSDFVPYIKEGYEMKDNLQSPNEFSKRRDIYFLPPSLLTSRIKTADAEIASEREQQTIATPSSFAVGSPYVGYGSMNQQDITNGVQVGATMDKFVGQATRVPNAKYLGFNKIQLFNFPEKCCILFKVKCEHDLSLETIEEGYYTTFVELATLDVQRTLYNNLKHMNNVGSAFKEIQLKIEEWSGAETAQKELLKEWKNVFHLDDIDLIQFF